MSDSTDTDSFSKAGSGAGGGVFAGRAVRFGVETIVRDVKVEALFVFAILQYYH
jgi:hypothetical protein